MLSHAQYLVGYLYLASLEELVDPWVTNIFMNLMSSLSLSDKPLLLPLLYLLLWVKLTI